MMGRPMFFNTDNPIFKRLTRHETTQKPDKLTWVLLGLVTLTSVGGMWLSLLDYPRVAFNTLPWLMVLAAILLSMMLLSVTVSVIRAETDSEAFPLLFLTNIGREPMVWGMVLAMLWRYRRWVALYGWLVWIAGWLSTIGLYDVFQNDLQTSQASLVMPPYRPTFLIPSLYNTLTYGVVWGVFAVGSVLVVVGTGVVAGFRRTDLIVTVLRAGFSVVVLHVPIMLLLSPVMLFDDRLSYQVPLIVAVLLVTLMVAMTAARRWKMDPRWVWHSFPEVVSGTVFVWLLGVVVLFWVSDRALYWRFVVLYAISVVIITGQLRLRQRGPLAVRVLMSGLAIAFVLVYVGLLEIQSLPDVLAVIAFVFAVQIGRWWLVGILTRAKRTQPRFIANSAIQVALAVGLYTLIVGVDDRANGSRFALIPVLAALIVVGWCFSLAATWRTYRGLSALMTLIMQITFLASVIHDGYLIGQVLNVEDENLLTNWWFAAALVAAMVGAGLAGIRGGVRHVWPSEYVV